MREPAVSVIIIFLNEERFLPEAIESVFGQTYTNWELLLIDDGSSDGSVGIARQYARQHANRVRYLDHEGHRNRGMSASRNFGIQHARGKYIALGDADDVWLPLKLECHVGVLESEPEVTMVYGPMEFWFSWTGNAEDRERDFVPQLRTAENALLQPPELLTLSLKVGAPAVVGSLVRRDVFERRGGFEASFPGLFEDQAFLTKVFVHEPVFASSECVYRYRMHPHSCVSIGLRQGRIDAHRWTYLKWLENYLLDHRVADKQLWKALRKQMWPYRHRFLDQARQKLAHVFGEARWGLEKALLNIRGPLRWVVRGVRGSLSGPSGPVPVFDDQFADRFPCVATKLFWTVIGTETVEVRVDARNGPLLSRTGPTGSKMTGKWVRDGMVFYLQDVSDNRPLTSANTLDMVKVRVASRAPADGRPRTS